MVAVTDTSPEATITPVETGNPTPATPTRSIGVVPTASMITGAAIALVWFWVPLTILIVGVSSIPSVIGFLLAGVVFVYLMRGADRVLKDAAPRTVDATTRNGDVIVAVPARGPYVVNATTENGHTAIRVPRANDREKVAAVITLRSENGDVTVDDLR